jgi:hypothetical protein
MERNRRLEEDMTRRSVVQEEAEEERKRSRLLVAEQTECEKKRLMNVVAEIELEVISERRLNRGEFLTDFGRYYYYF